MAENFYTLLTDIGLAKVANAQITQEKIDLVEMAVGDGGGSYYNPSSAQTDLVNEVWKGPISLVGIDENNDHWINIESAIPANGGGFFIREVGLFDEDGDLVAIGKYPETYKPKIDEGSSKDLYIRMIIEVSNASSITLKVDPTIIIATRKFVDDKIALSVGPINQSLQDLQVIVDENKDGLTTHLAESVSWQKFKLTKDDGYVKRLSDLDFTPTSMVELQAGNYYVTTEEGRNNFSDNVFEGQGKFIEVLMHTGDNVKYIRVTPNSVVSMTQAWKVGRLDSEEDSGWIIDYDSRSVSVSNTAPTSALNEHEQVQVY